MTIADPEIVVAQVEVETLSAEPLDLALLEAIAGGAATVNTL